MIYVSPKEFYFACLFDRGVGKLIDIKIDGSIPYSVLVEMHLLYIRCRLALLYFNSILI